MLDYDPRSVDEGEYSMHRFSNPRHPYRVRQSPEQGDEMHSKEKLYHIANVAAVHTAALSAFLLVSMGRLADEGQISMSSPGMSLASLLLFTVAGVCVLWIAASSLIHVRMKAGVRKNGNGLIKNYAVIVVLLVLLFLLSTFTPLWMAGLAPFAFYLFVVSARALIINNFSQDTR